MTVRALNFRENWLDDNVPNEPFTTDCGAAAEAFAARLIAAAQAEGIAVEEFGDEVENLTDFIREALESRANYVGAVDAKWVRRRSRI